MGLTNCGLDCRCCFLGILGDLFHGVTSAWNGSNLLPNERHLLLVRDRKLGENRGSWLSPSLAGASTLSLASTCRALALRGSKRSASYGGSAHGGRARQFKLALLVALGGLRPESLEVLIVAVWVRHYTPDMIWLFVGVGAYIALNFLVPLAIDHFWDDGWRPSSED